MPDATSEQIEGLRRQINSLEGRIQFYDKKWEPYGMFFRIARHDPGTFTQCMEAYKVSMHCGKKRLTLDEFEQFLPASIKLPWKS